MQPSVKTPSGSRVRPNINDTVSKYTPRVSVKCLGGIIESYDLTISSKSYTAAPVNKPISSLRSMVILRYRVSLVGILVEFYINFRCANSLSLALLLQVW